MTVAGQMQRRVVGTPAEVAATVALARQTGRVLSVTTARQLDPADPRVTVIVTLRALPQAAVRQRRWVKPAVIAGVAAILGAVGWALLVLVRQVIAVASTHAPVIVGGLVLLGLVLLVVTRGLTGRCPGLHCSGCGRH